ncbi:MAG: metallophosphoesterase, partial [Proteobacteria bacterium]|nr:metallophosphoesterase [Pseudomonadota bacterium]
MQKIFEDPYKTLIQRGLVFYQTFGNHDMEFGRHNAQLKYSLDRNVLATGKGGWAIPADDYVITRGDLKIVVTNTAAMDLSVVLPPSRLQWLEKSLCHSQERWVFLAMHYPFWSSNKHGDNLELQKTLSPLLKSCRIDGLLAGHDHGAEVLQTPLDLKQFVIGNAAESRMPDGDTSGVSEWRSGSLGFGGLKISGGEAVLTFYDERGQAIHTVSLQARNP